MTRVFLLHEGKLREGGLPLLDQPGPHWIDIAEPTEADTHWLATRFGFHPLALEDCLHLDQRPKLEEYPGSIFVVVHCFTRGASCTELKLHELHCFLTDQVLVTVHADAIPVLDEFRTRLGKDASVFSRGPDALLHLVCDVVTDANLPLVDDIHEAIEELEERVFQHNDRSVLENVFELKRTLLTLRRTLAPARDVYAALSRPGRVSDRTAHYYRDVWDHVVRLTESIDAARELLSDVTNVYHSELGNRTNDVMKRLALFSALLLPLTFLTGFFGMNFEDIPYKEHWLLTGSFVAMLLAPLATVAIFRWNRWL